MGILKAKVEDRELVLCGSANRPLTHKGSFKGSFHGTGVPSSVPRRALFECLPPEAAPLSHEHSVRSSRGVCGFGSGNIRYGV